MQNRVTFNHLSEFPTEMEDVLPHLLRLKTLQHIAAPFVVFSPVSELDGLDWREGNVSKFHLRLFGFIPMGVHEIAITLVQKLPHCCFIMTEERNRYIPLWKHQVIMMPTEKDTVEYADIIEIKPSRFSWAIVLWGKAFLRHRQKKLRLLLLDNAPISPS